MRRQLLVSMLAAVSLAILLLGLPLAALVRQTLYSEEIAQARREAQGAIAVLNSELGSFGPAVGVRLLAQWTGARVTLLDTAGRVITDSAGVNPGSVFDDPSVLAALEGRVGYRIDGGEVTVAVPDRVRGTPVVLRMAEPAEGPATRLRSAWLAIAGVALTALGAGAALAWWRGQQLARPLESLAGSARRLGQGDFSERASRSGIAEIDEIAAALDATADRLGGALERSTSFSADASHQLRTPLTALRLDLEAAHGRLPEGPERGFVTAALGEVDRLEATIEELLELADSGSEPDLVDLVALVHERVRAAQTIAQAAGRSVHLSAQRVPWVRARPGAIGQALQVLLDNALKHGVGAVTVSLEAVSRGDRTWVRACVGDEGPGPRPEDVTGDAAEAQGRGFVLARSLMRAEGGRLALDHGGRPARTCLLLPAAAAERERS